MPRADVVVIGVGLAGLTAAARLAEAGASVALVAKGHASTHWGAGGIDVAAPGRRPHPGRGRRDAGRRARPSVRGARRGRRHRRPPGCWASWPGPGLPYVGTPETPIRRVPTAIGGTRRVAIVPEAQAAALRPWEPDEVLVVAGPAGFKDFWPAAIADSLSRDAVWHGVGPARAGRGRRRRARRGSPAAATSTRSSSRTGSTTPSGAPRTSSGSRSRSGAWPAGGRGAWRCRRSSGCAITPRPGRTPERCCRSTRSRSRSCRPACRASACGRRSERGSGPAAAASRSASRSTGSRSRTAG